MIDSVTGEILEDDSAETSDDYENDLVYKDLQEAERAIFGIEASTGAARLNQIRILLGIQERQLYKQRVNIKTDSPFKSMEEYFPEFLRAISSISREAPRTLKLWMSKYKIFCRELGREEDDLLKYGSHYDVMLPLAARNAKTLELSKEDEPLPSGGKKLGAQGFGEFVKKIEERVDDSRAHPESDELRWKVSQTKEEVDEILGKEENDVAIEFKATWSSENNIKLIRVVYWCDGRAYESGDVMPYSVLEKIAKGGKVTELEMQP